MNFEVFRAAVARGGYASALSAAPEIFTLLRQQREYSPSSPEFKLLKQAADVVWPFRLSILTTLRNQDIQQKGAAVLCGLLLKIPAYRAELSEGLLQLFLHDPSPQSESSAAQALFYAPALPELQNAFGSHLIRVYPNMPPALRAHVLCAIGALEYEPGAPLAEQGMMSEDDELVIASEVLFRRLVNPYTIALLQRLLRSLPPEHLGWVVAVRSLTHAGLLANQATAGLLELLAQPEVLPRAQAYMAVCLTQITLSEEVASRALTTMREICRKAIDESRSNVSQILERRDDSTGDWEQGMLFLIEALGEQENYCQTGLHDLFAEAIASGNSWAMRCRGADALHRISFPAHLKQSMLLPALISALDLVIETGAWNPEHPGICTDASFTEALLDLAKEGVDMQAAQEVLRRYLRQIPQSLRQDDAYRCARQAYKLIIKT